MNLDFHYYATYHAARIAGFEEWQAQEIANSAQMVDELTPALVNERKLKAEDYTITCQDVTDNVLDEFHMLSDEYGETLQKIRKVWVPFHFLPGNLPNEQIRVEYLGKKDWAGIKYQETGAARDKRDFQCMCCPNSKLVTEMIRDTVEVAKREEGKGKFDILQLIGIRMHVLADTWAHQSFVGSPNYWINDVSDVQSGETEIKHNWTSTPGASNYEITYLGHGRIGHLPDYGYAQYSYLPKWSSVKIEVNNEQRFLSAFDQMVKAMKCIFEDQTFAITNSRDEYMTDEIRDAITFRAKDEKEIYQHWERFTDIAPFCKEQQSEKLMCFSNMARYHRDFVIRYVNKAFKDHDEEPYFTE